MQRQLSPDDRSDWYDRSAPDADALIRWRGSVALHCPPPVEYYVYVLHFHSRYYHAGHYLGVTACLDARLLLHKLGRGARLMKAVVAAGITFELARLWQLATWEEARGLERTLKKRQNGPGLCPLCRGEQVDLLVAHASRALAACAPCSHRTPPADGEHQALLCAQVRMGGAWRPVQQRPRHAVRRSQQDEQEARTWMNSNGPTILPCWRAMRTPSPGPVSAAGMSNTRPVRRSQATGCPRPSASSTCSRFQEQSNAPRAWGTGATYEHAHAHRPRATG